MELVCIDKQTFEELRVRFCEFEDRVTRLCRPVEDLGLKNWLDNQEVCDVLRINKKTLQAYRAKGLLPFSRIKNIVGIGNFWESFFLFIRIPHRTAGTLPHCQ